MSAGSGAHTAKKSVENTVFVRFQPPSDAIRRHHVEDAFSEIGPIKKCSVIHTHNDQTVTSSFGFVKYTVQEDAALAAVKLNNRQINVGNGINVTVKVELAEKGHTNSTTAGPGRGKDSSHRQQEEVEQEDETAQSKKKTNRLIVRNLSFYAKEKDIRQSLSQFGELEEVHIPCVQKTGGHRGFCFVTFSDEKAVKKCLKAAEVTIKDRTVNVARSLHKTAYQAQQPPRGKGEEEKPKAEAKGRIRQETNEENDGEDGDDASDSDGDSQSGSDDDRESGSDEEEDDDSGKKKGKQTSDSDKTAVSEKRCLFLRNLPFDCTRHDVFETFRQFGYITSIFIVKDKETHTIPKGTAFVSFQKPEQATKALEFASAQANSFVSQRSASVEEQYEQPRSQGGGIVLKGRRLLVDLAVDKETATTLTVTERKEGEASHGKDRRNLYLKGEGRVENDEKNGVLTWDELPETDKVKRQTAWSEKNTKLRSPLFFINPHRLSLRNLAKHVDETALKQLCVDAAIRGLEKNLVTAEDQIAHWRAGGEMSTREILARIQEETGKNTATASSAPASIIPPFDTKNIKQFIPSVHVHRDFVPGANKKVAPSRGFGFVEFQHHVHALACLRELNNNTRYSAEYATGGKQAADLKRRRSGKQKKKGGSQSVDVPEDGPVAALVDENGRVRTPRLIVEFTVENKAKAKQQADHRAQQQVNQIKQIGERKAKGEQSGDKEKKTKSKKSRGKAQRERKRKGLEEGEGTSTSEQLVAEAKADNATRSNKNASHPDSQPEAKRKTGKPPKKRKVLDEEETNFTKLVETHKLQAISIMGGDGVANEDAATKKKDTRWFDE